MSPAATAAIPPGGAGAGRALVAFSGRTELKRLRFLKPGFRHVLAVVEAAPPGPAAAGGWLLFNPLAGGTEACILPPGPEAALVRWLEGEGFRVVATDRRPPAARPRGLRPHTCVEAVARLIGLEGRWVFTPWQLYRRLRALDHNRKINLDKGP